MWKIQGISVDPTRFEPLEPLHVLNFYDGPRIFTFLDGFRELCLAVWSDEDQSHSRFLVVPVTEKTVFELEKGLLSVRDALKQPQLWVLDHPQQPGPSKAWSVEFDLVPEDAKPHPGVLLHRSLEANFRQKAIGQAPHSGDLTHYHLPGSVD